MNRIFTLLLAQGGENKTLIAFDYAQLPMKSIPNAQLIQSRKPNLVDWIKVIPPKKPKFVV